MLRAAHPASLGDRSSSVEKEAHSWSQYQHSSEGGGATHLPSEGPLLLHPPSQDLLSTYHVLTFTVLPSLHPPHLQERQVGHRAYNHLMSRKQCLLKLLKQQKTEKTLRLTQTSMSGKTFSDLGHCPRFSTRLGAKSHGTEALSLLLQLSYRHCVSTAEVSSALFPSMS